MSTFLATSLVSQLDLYLLRRDYFDGFSVLLQDSDGLPLDLTAVQVCASVWKKSTGNSVSLVSTINTEKQEPLTGGKVRLWLTSEETATIWDAYGESASVGGTFFPSAYTAELLSSPLIWDVRIESEERVAGLFSASGGTFISQTNHTLASSERAIFRGTGQSSINYNGTSARIYSDLTNISYQAPYSFTVPTLSGITDANVGGSVYRLKQDTVLAGNVYVGQTLSNCFP